MHTIQAPRTSAAEAAVPSVEKAPAEQAQVPRASAAEAAVPSVEKGPAKAAEGAHDFEEAGPGQSESRHRLPANLLAALNKPEAEEASAKAAEKASAKTAEGAHNFPPGPGQSESEGRHRLPGDLLAALNKTEAEEAPAKAAEKASAKAAEGAHNLYFYPTSSQELGPVSANRADYSASREESWKHSTIPKPDKPSFPKKLSSDRKQQLEAAIRKTPSVVGAGPLAEEKKTPCARLAAAPLAEEKIVSGNFLVSSKT